ncbi:hypothetical protein FRC01_004763, partial [Tulasnella sp. 417]
VFVASPGGEFSNLQGPKNDLELLLKVLRYRHYLEDRKIILIHDFTTTFTDQDEETKQLPKTASTRGDI